jgi:anti-sigma factor RsiW
MSACDEFRPLLHGLADGELDASSVIEIEGHVAGCRGCHEEFARLLQLSAVLNSADLRYRAPGYLRERIERSCAGPRRILPPRIGGWIFPGAGGAIAATLALMLARPVIMQAPVAQPQMEQELVQSHVRSLLVDHLIDVATSNDHVVRPWFDGKIDFAPRAPNLAPQGFPLLGGRLDYAGGRTVAAIVYQRRQHKVNLFVWPAPAASDRALDEDGYSIVEWSDDGLRYAAVSDASRVDLEQLRSAFRQSARGTEGADH